MRTLINSDYNRIIQKLDLDQITLGDWSIVYSTEAVVKEEISSYISKRYDISKIFVNLDKFSLTNTYYAGDITYISENDWNDVLTYNPGDRVRYPINNVEYVFINTATASGATYSPTNGSYWNQGVLDGSLYYVNYPYPLYNQSQVYVTGDKVLYNNIIYTAIKDNNGDYLNEDSVYDVDSFNTSAIIPGYSTKWSDYWTAATSSYTVSGIQPDTDNTGVWQAGDNRNQLILQYMMDMVLYHVCASINPRNIPELRGIRYDGASPSQLGGAVGFFKKVSQGQLSLNAVEIIPTSGQSLYWTSSERRTLDY